MMLLQLGLSHEAADSVVALAVVGKGLWDLFRGRRRDQRQTSSMGALRTEIIGRFDQVEERTTARIAVERAERIADVKSVRVLVRGENGDNGLQSDIRRMETAREKERDERHARNDELQGTLTSIEVEQRAQGERLKAVERDVGRLVENENQKRLHGTPDRRNTQ